MLRDLLHNIRIIVKFVEIDDLNVSKTVRHVEAGLMSNDEDVAVLTLIFLRDFAV